MKGWYLCNMWGGSMIAYDKHIAFASEEQAERFKAFRKFSDAKAYQIAKIKAELESLQQDLAYTEQLKASDILKQ